MARLTLLWGSYLKGGSLFPLCRRVVILIRPVRALGLDIKSQAKADRSADNGHMMWNSEVLSSGCGEH